MINLDAEKVKAMFPDISPDCLKESFPTLQPTPCPPLPQKGQQAIQLPLETHQALQDKAAAFMEYNNYLVEAVRPGLTYKDGEPTYRTPWQYQGKGRPDLFGALMRRERVNQKGLVWVEIKVGKDKLSLDQIKWRDVIIAAGGHWFELRPERWDEFEEWIV